MRNKRIVLMLMFMSIVSAVLSGCSESKTEENQTPDISYADLKVGETATDISAELNVLTNRTDLIDTDFAEYIAAFQKMYPNVKIKYEGITNYESDMTTRLTTDDWGDICCIPATVELSKLGTYFESFGDVSYLSEIYEFTDKKMYNTKVYGIPSMGTVNGIVYNKAVFEKAGITEIPKTPEEFLDGLERIKENTEAVPLYTNYASGWALTAWDAYISGCATGDASFKNQRLVHESNPFSKRSDMTGPYAVYYTLYEAVKRGLTEEDPSTSDWESCKGMLNEGRIGCMVLGSWSVLQMTEAGSNGDDVAYMPFPITVDGKQYVSAGADYCYGVNVNSSSDEKTAAMLYIKYLAESSGYAVKQGGIPTMKGAEYPEFLEGFKELTFVSDSAALAGEEDLFDKINNRSELSLDSDSTHVAEIVESAIDGSKTLDEIVDEWNAAWTNAQESSGIIPE